MKKEPDPVDFYVGQNLKFVRLENNMSRVEFGRLVSLSSQQIQKYEFGINRISASRLWYFSIILNKQPGWFFEGFADFIENDEHGSGVKQEKENIAKFVVNFFKIEDKPVRNSILKLMCSLEGK